MVCGRKRRYRGLRNINAVNVWAVEWIVDIGVLLAGADYQAFGTRGGGRGSLGLSPGATSAFPTPHLQ